jgi:AraC-like DNA-binding protein
MNQILPIAHLVIGIQSFLLTLYFLSKKKGTRVLNHLMAITAFSLTLIVFNTYVSLGDFTFSSGLLQDLANNSMWFVGPALFGYVNYGTKELDISFFLKHFVPYLIPLAIDLIFEWQFYNEIIPFIGLAQIFIYLGLSIKTCLNQYEERKEFFSWVLPAISVFALLVLINFIMNLLNAINIIVLDAFVVQSFTIILFIPIYFITYKEMNSTYDFGIKPIKYGTTPLELSKMEAYLKIIDNSFFERQLFKEKNLTLAKLSSEIDISSKYISQVINQMKQMSFSDYLTKQRVEEAKKQLIDPDKKYLSIAGIADDSGFASTSRFNILFKQHTGFTPSEFQKKHL